MSCRTLEALNVKLFQLFKGRELIKYGALYMYPLQFKNSVKLLLE